MASMCGLLALREQVPKGRQTGKVLLAGGLVQPLASKEVCSLARGSL